MMTGQDIICISTSEWDFLPTRKQRLMALLARQGNRVLYVDPCYADRSERLSPRNGLWKAYRPRTQSVAENLWLMKPPFPLPLGRFGWSRALTSIRLANGIHQFLGEHGFNLPLLWIYPPTAISVVDQIPHRALIYEVVDDYAEYSTYGEAMRRYIRHCERAMLRRADLVFVTSAELLEGREEVNPNIFVSPNGVDCGLFSRAQDSSVEVAEDIGCLSRPILGFVGGIAPWTDLDMAFGVALRRPGWSLVFIGPVTAGLDVARFTSLSNVHFLGRRPPEVLPAYLKGMDACLNLFKKTALTRAVNPLKLYEYLAAGKPVVSTPMPEAEKFGDLVTIADDPDAFVSGVEHELTRAHDLCQITARMDAVLPFSWERIFDQIMTKVAEIDLEEPGEALRGGGIRGI